jgi:tetratricopeptide (TPR) repeat protein
VIQESLFLEPELARMLSLEYEGNPLGAGLLLREWAARRHLVLKDRGVYGLAPEVALSDALPPDMDSLMRRRVAAAVETCADPAAATQALAAIALAGQEPPVSLIRRVNDAGLDALLATGIVAEERGCLVFEHSRLRAVALEDAGKLPGISELHIQCAEAWEALGKETDLDVDLPMGMHRSRAGLVEAALGPLLTAVRRMNAGGRARDAIAVAAVAIEAADRSGQTTARLEARRVHAAALLESGEPQRAAPLIDHALGQIEGDRLTRGRLRVLRGRAARKLGDLEMAHREFDAAHQVFEALRDRAGLIEIAVQRAKLARTEGDNAATIDLWGEVLRLNRGDLVLEAEALNGMVEGLIRSGRLEHLDKHLARLQTVSRASGDTRRIAEATATWGLISLERRQFDEAENALRSAGAIAATLGADRLHLRCRSMLAEVCRWRGDWDEAEETARWAARFAEERSFHLQHAGARVRLAGLAVLRDDNTRLRAEMDIAEKALQAAPRHRLWLHVGVLKALIAAQDGDERTCRAWWAVARERGLFAARVSELWVPLRRLGAATRSRGWIDIASRAEALVKAGDPEPASEAT